MVYDYGFAPNPFLGYCTLATCKPGIRKAASIGDWVIGTGGKTKGWNNRLIYLMLVTDKVTIQEYWSNIKYRLKKPVINGSLIRIHGDNIYHKDDDGVWLQEDSQHSFESGRVNNPNLKKDIKGEFVLISNHFYYFGSYSVKLPKAFLSIANKGRNVKKIKDAELATAFTQWVEANFREGYIYGNPNNWSDYNQLKIHL
jgi:hypothetical protein